MGLSKERNVSHFGQGQNLRFKQYYQYFKEHLETGVFVTILHACMQNLNSQAFLKIYHFIVQV